MLSRWEGSFTLVTYLIDNLQCELNKLLKLPLNNM